MSEENVQGFRRVLEAYERRDIEAVLEALDPEVEWHAGIQRVLEGEAAVRRGHEGVREWIREVDDTLSELHLDLPDVREAGNQLVAIGRIRIRGKASGAVTESPVGYVADIKDGKVIRMRSYLDPKDALDAAGLSE